MSWLIASALRLRLVVVALAVVLLLVGQRVLPHAALDVFPEFAPPRVEIQTEAPGLSAADVESLVTVPLENAVNGTPWMTTIRSNSVLGLSSVVVLYERGVDLMAARQLVQERVSRVASALPAAAHAPVLLSPVSSTSRVLKIGLWSDTLSQMDLTELARWTLRPRLMAVPGVANVAIWGQRDRQLQVLVEPDRLRAHGVGLDQVLAATRAAVAVGGGGFLDTPNQRLALSFLPSVRTSDDLARALLAARPGAPLLLGDVATVVEGFPPPIGDAIVNDVPGLLLVVEKQPWGNTLQVTRAVERVLDDVRPALAGVEIDSTIFRPASFIEHSLANLRRALLIGAVLIVVVLAFFLYEWRTALISLIALPLSLVAAALIIHYRGGALDTMVLAGLVIALGEVVDDAIIDVENIWRRLRLNPNPEQPAWRVVLDASLEVRGAVVYASMIVALVLVPVLLMPGLAGSLFRPLALAYILAILSSLVVALTVTPALALMLLPSASDRAHEAPLVRVLRRGYRAILPRFLYGRSAAWVAGISAALALAVWPLLGREFLPQFREYDFLMHWIEKPGTSIEAMDRITARVSRELRAVPGVRNFGSHIGRAEVADEIVGTNFAELWISVDPQVDYTATLARIQRVVDGYPGIYRDVLTYLRERFKEVLTGKSASIVVRIYGPDLDGLRAAAARVRDAIAGVEGVADLHLEEQTLVPQLEVRLRPEAAALHGLTTAELQDAVATLVRGTAVGEVYQQQRVVEVVVRGAPGTGDDPERLRELPILTAAGRPVPLGELAEVAIRPAPNSIAREGASRRIDVTCNAAGRDLGAVARDVEQRVRALAFERGYHPEFLGEYTERQAAGRRLLLLSGLVLLGIFLLVEAAFGELRLAALVVGCLPFALVGGVAAVVLSGGVVSLGSLVGLVTVLGIAARNTLMLVSHCRHLEREEGVPFGPALVQRAAEERLAPILMTALAAGLALLPIVVGGLRPGYEIERPMAVVILGGLVTSTALNLFLLPALYLRWIPPLESLPGELTPAATRGYLFNRPRPPAPRRRGS